MSEESEETGTPVGSLGDLLEELQEAMVQKLNEEAKKSEGMKSLTDKQIADYLREKAPYVIDRIYRDLSEGAGPINSSDMTPQPLPMKFMTRALSLGVSKIRLNFSGGSDEGHLHIDFLNNDGKQMWTYDDKNEGLADLDSEIDTWVWDTHEYNGAGDGSSYGDIICYNLEEGTVTTEAWWTQEVHGGEKSDTMETC